MATESKRIRRDAFIKSVRPDPKSTEELVLLQGYIGDSDLANHVRVYSDAALSDFIDLPEQDVLYSDPVSTEEDSLGGSRLWVKKTTVFTAGDPKLANRVKSTFLEGDIVRAFGNQGVVRPPRVVAQEVPSAFLEAGCRQFSEPFEICHGPTGALDPNCVLVEPPNTLPTKCGKQTCVQPTCRVGCNISRRPFAICISVNNNTCQVAAGIQLPASFPCPNTVLLNCHPASFACSDNNPSCAQTCFVAWTGFCLTFNCVGLTNPATKTVVGNPIAQSNYDYATYTGGFNPYQTANYGY